MKRLMCKIAYDGTQFSGYQIQLDQRTVQGEIETALKKVHKGDMVRIYTSGRTDTGVHARGQVIHFDTPLAIPDEKWPIVLNTLLPGDIVVQDAQTVNANFNARFDVEKKEYRYRVSRSSYPNVFLRNYTYHYPYKLNLSNMKQAIQHLIGTHDFTSFCSARSDVEDRVRTIYELDMVEQEEELVFRIVGNGFLYNMVRIIVGTLLNVGEGKIKPDDLIEIIHMKDRKHAGKTVPGHGLILWEVTYKN